MRILILLPCVYAAAVLETSLADAISVGRVAPDLLALVAAIWGLVARGRRTFLAAGAVGLVADLLSPGRLGVGMATFLLVGYGLARLQQKLALDHFLWQLPVVGLAVTAIAAGQAAARWLLGEAALPLSTLLVQAAGEGLYTTGVGLPVLMLLGWIREPFRSRQQAIAGF